MNDTLAGMLYVVLGIIALSFLSATLAYWWLSLVL